MQWLVLCYILKVPTFRHGDIVICESLAIVDYLEVGNFYANSIQAHKYNNINWSVEDIEDRITLLIEDLIPDILEMSQGSNSLRASNLERLTKTHILWWQFVSMIMLLIGWSGRGVPDTRPPPLPWDPILSFFHTFLAKSACVGGPRPPPTGNPGSVTVANGEYYYTLGGVCKPGNAFSSRRTCKES